MTKGTLPSVLGVSTMASLASFALFGCGNEGPTGPEPTSLPELFGDQLLRADGSSVGVGVLANTSLVGIYFASPGCPACTAFNPVLTGAYAQLKEEGRSFEIVLVAFGVTDSAMLAYMAESGMVWLALSPQSAEANALAQRYDIRWVPTLVIIDGAGNTVSKNGREEVTQRGAAAFDLWLAASGGG